MADALQRAADDVFRRGASAMAAELYEHAHRLTPTSARVDRHRRARRAARHHWTAGDVGRGRSLLEAAVADAPFSAARAEALTRLGWVCAGEGDLPRAAEHARAALAEPDVTLSTRAEAENCLASALMFMGEALEEAARSAARCATFGAREQRPSAAQRRPLPAGADRNAARRSPLGRLSPSGRRPGGGSGRVPRARLAGVAPRRRWASRPAATTTRPPHSGA